MTDSFPKLVEHRGKDMGKADIAMNDGGYNSRETSALPLQPMAHLLRQNQVEDWDPRVVYQLLVFQYNVTKKLLNDAKMCSIHRGGHGLIDTDVKLALELEEENRPYKVFNDEAVADVAADLPRISPENVRVPSGAFVGDPILDLEMQTIANRAAMQNRRRKNSEDVNMVHIGVPDNMEAVDGAYNIRKSKKEITVTFSPGGQLPPKG